MNTHTQSLLRELLGQLMVAHSEVSHMTQYNHPQRRNRVWEAKKARDEIRDKIIALVSEKPTITVHTGGGCVYDVEISTGEDFTLVIEDRGGLIENAETVDRVNKAVTSNG